jgi:hypothetical protein
MQEKVKTIALTFMAVASLTIATLSTEADEIRRPETGRDITEGNMVIHLGAPVLVPDLTAGGKWVPFPPYTDKEPTTYGERYEEAMTKLKNALLWEQTPTVTMENGLVVGHAAALFNHDGKAFVGFTITGIEHDLNAVTYFQLPSDLASLQEEYRQNIRSGKWHKFVNGE